MNGFLDALRVENLKTGLHVLTVLPGFTASNIRNTALAADGTQQGESTLQEDKMMTSDDVAQLIVQGIKNRSRTLIMTRQGKLTSVLSKFLPGFLDKLVYKTIARENNSLLK